MQPGTGQSERERERERGLDMAHPAPSSTPGKLGSGQG